MSDYAEGPHLGVLMEDMVWGLDEAAFQLSLQLQGEHMDSRLNTV
jgi:hypothetical protein